MSAHFQSPIIVSSARPRREVVFDGVAERESIQPLSVRASAAFSVAPSRLFYALTIPEYIETWLTPPDTDEIRCIGNPAAGEPLSIELRYDRRTTASIFADYNSISTQDINIRWYVRSRRESYATQLRIAVRTMRADAILRLRHSGFTHPNDWHWHQELWSLSLAKMQVLIR
jgi:hypothetical protein